MTDPQKPGDPVGRATAIVGLLTAAATLVVIPGSLALLGRLAEAKLPANLGVVVSLPSQFLVAIGLTYVLAPLALVVGLAVLVLVLPIGDNTPNPALQQGTTFGGWCVTVALMVILALGGSIPLKIDASAPAWTVVVGFAVALVACYGVLRLARQRWRGENNVYKQVPAWALLHKGTEHRRDRALVVVFAALAIIGMPIAVYAIPPPWWSFLASAAFVAAWLISSWLVAQEHQAPKRDTRPILPWAGLLLVVAITAFVVPTIEFAIKRGGFPPTTVCTTNGQRIDGVLVGETSDRVYVGESPTRIVVFTDPERRALAADLTGALRAAGYDVRPQGSPADITFGRVRLAIAVLDDLDTQAELERLKGSGVKVLGYYEGDTGLQRAQQLGISSPIPLNTVTPGFSAKTRRHLRRRVSIVLRQQEKLSEREGLPPERVRRISAIPSGEVKRLYVGGSGACAGVE